MQAEIEGQKLWIPGQAASSGHLLIPVDNWTQEAVLEWHRTPKPALHARDELIAAYCEDGYHGLELDDVLQEEKAPMG